MEEIFVHEITPLKKMASVKADIAKANGDKRTKGIIEVEKLNELFLNLPEEERKKEFSGLYIEREMLEGVPVKGEITEKNLFLITDGLVLSDMPKYAGVDVYNRMFFNGQLSEENEEATIYRGVWHLGATALDRENLSPAKRDLVMQYRDGTFTFTRENGLYLPK